METLTRNLLNLGLLVALSANTLHAGVGIFCASTAEKAANQYMTSKTLTNTDDKRELLDSAYDNSKLAVKWCKGEFEDGVNLRQLSQALQYKIIQAQKANNSQIASNYQEVTQEVTQQPTQTCSIFVINDDGSKECF